MLLASIAIAFSLALTTPASAAPVARPSVGFALVVTNNRSLTSSRPDLQYADDDGAKYANLFSDELGAGQVTLLADFDVASRRLYPEWSSRALAPTRANLDNAVARLASDIARAQADGASVQLYLVFAGHGDVDHGQGYLDLADQRLTARDLDEGVLARLKADRVHLIFDSCNSYFMLNPRKPGGKRWETNPNVAGVLDKYPNLGAIISTSAEAVTYEWSELQSGIFSYELRSGLRGAADVDGNGQVSYAELAAFVEAANQDISNDLYRPKVFARGPAHDNNQALLTRYTSTRVLKIEAAGARRLTLRDAQGTRLVDLNKEDGTRVALSLPTEHVAIYEQTPGKERPLVSVRNFDGSAGPVAMLDELPRAEPDLNGRGEAPVFAALFASPFGARAFAAAQAAPKDMNPAYFGITRRDADQLRSHLEMTLKLDQDRFFMVGWGMALATVVGADVLGISLANSNMKYADKRDLVISTAMIPAIFGGVVLVRSFFRSDSEKLLADFDSKDLSTEVGRGRSVLEMRDKFHRLAEHRRRLRHIGGGILLGAAAAEAVVGGVGLGQHHGNQRAPDYVLLTNAAIFGGLGALFIGVDHAPVERTWELYEATEGGATAGPKSEPPSANHTSASVTPLFGVTSGGAFFGVGGNF
ncbi:MAG TPA: caspase family protein [Polyangia bacterium]|jgi:Caspase domain.|nr:caspase family protein [Polyangia bacterium]